MSQLKKANNINTTYTSNLVKKTDYDTNISEIENKITTYNSKYITTQEFNKLTSEILAARLVQGNLTNKNDIANFVNRPDIDNKLLSFKKRVN